MNCTPPNEITCETCKYCVLQKAPPPEAWEVCEMDRIGDMYFCHYNPPTKGGTFLWPDVSKDSFCGKHTLKMKK